MDNFVITIARQYGSGGRTIGEELAKKLGISYYDKDIIRMGIRGEWLMSSFLEGQMKMSAQSRDFLQSPESTRVS